MGNPRGFLEVDRRDAGYRPVDERIKDYNEVEKHLPDSEIREQASRCMDCGIPFCHGAGCSLSNVIPEWNDLVYNDLWEDAYKLLSETSNFPEFTSRICPALCEASCTVGVDGDPSVSIRHIEFAIIENAFEKGWVKAKVPSTRNGKKIAVIGGGPSGLAAASDLNQKGYSVTVYEKDQFVGGFMRYGIPDFKFDKKIIERRVDILKEEGIVFETGVEIGKDISGSYLKKHFDAIALACGCRVPRDLPIPNRELNGIHFALDFLSQNNRKVSGEEFSDLDITAKGKNVVVIGGGDTGSDCVGTSNRQGAKSVTQIEIMPKPPETRHEGTPWPMWPYQLRTSSSHKEGCVRDWDVKSSSFEGKDGNVVKVNANKVKWEVAPNGRPLSMEDVKDSEYTIDADLVLLAMGFVGAEKNGLYEELGVELNKRDSIIVNADSATNVESIFAAGDLVTGPSLVVRVLAAGKKMAKDIDNYLS